MSKNDDAKFWTDRNVFSALQDSDACEDLVRCALIHHSISINESGNGGDLVYNSDGLTAEIFDITQLVREICSSKSACFYYDFLGGGPRVSMSSTGRKLNNLLKTGRYLHAEYYSSYALPPEVEMFLVCLNGSRIRWAELAWWEDISSPESVQAWVLVLNELVDSVRQAAERRAFVRRKQHIQRRIRKNLKSVLSGMVTAFQRHSKILALRLDVGFHKVSLNPQMHPKLSHKVVDDARKKLLTFIRKRFGKSLVWYLWKLEFGPDKGFHLHWVIFLNGSDHAQDINLTREVGEYWRSEVVPGDGVYFNCSAEKQRYRECALGALSAANPRIWNGLAYIAFYLTKIDYFVGAHISKNRRTLGMGTVKKSDGEKPGPKRKSGLTLPSNIERIVFGR